MRSSTNAWDSQAKKTISLPIGVPALQDNYAIEVDQPGDSKVKLLNQSQAESVAFRYRTLPSLSSKGLKKVYPNSTRAGYEIRITDSYIRETTNDTPAVVTDDPVQVEITFRTLDGANIVTGSDVLSSICHLLGFIIDYNSDGTIAADQKTLSRLIAGATKPAVLV